MVAGALARGEVAALANAQHQRHKAELRVAVGDRIVVAADGADADAAKREYAGLDRGASDHLDHLAHIGALSEVGRIFDGEMRHA